MKEFPGKKKIIIKKWEGIPITIKEKFIVIPLKLNCSTVYYIIYPLVYIYIIIYV